MMKYVPNILTVIRILLIGIYLLFFYSDLNYALYYAISIFILAGITDIADGYLARKYEVISKFGQVADPFADKAMQLTCLLTLAYAYYIDPWIAWIILGKEVFLILSGVILLLYKTKIIIPSNIFGKLTTVFIYIAILLSVLKVEYVNSIFYIVVLFAAVTLVQYIAIGIHKIRKYVEHEGKHA